MTVKYIHSLKVLKAFCCRCS